MMTFGGMEHLHFKSSRAEVEAALCILVATVSTFVVFCISVFTLSGHLLRLKQPKLQLPICRILILPPIVSATSWLSLVLPRATLLFAALRGCYEGYVIYAFFSLLVEYSGGEEKLADWFEMRGHIRHAWPFQRYMSSIRLGPDFLRRVKQGTLQFVFVKPCTVVFALVFAQYGLYNEGNFSPRQSYLYIGLLNNLSISLALYSLVLFYFAAKERLQPHHPFAKFAAIKIVVFLLYWQTLIVEGLTHSGLITSTIKPKALGDTIVCCEMVFAAMIHHVAFRNNTDEESDEEADAEENNPLLPQIAKVLDVKDILYEGKKAFLDDQKRPTEFDSLAVDV